MITVYIQHQVYVIEHFHKGTPAHSLRFGQELFPEKLRKGLATLPFFQGSHKTNYTLNGHQEEEVDALFQKIEAEDHSEYRFARELRLTYLVELLHVLMKLHLQQGGIVS